MVKYYLRFEMLLRELLNRNEQASAHMCQKGETFHFSNVNLNLFSAPNHTLIKILACHNKSKDPIKLIIALQQVTLY